MTHRLPIRVYYEDTDLGQVVYYANYLKFIERGRSEYLRQAGIDQARLLADHSLAFVVRRVEADYLRPARFDDLVEVVTTLDEVAGSRLTLTQTVDRDGQTLFSARVTIVCVDLGAMRAHRVPAHVRAALGRPEGA
ncbi:tol-pal system-associated acyl-CoA thioesterase [Paracoccus luteus]|uniref:tol-pal system-associated acyl-CoA thioesterase n=1 Tax=Paracoccus luteus TaxID=2508543 RepID=UPI00106F7D5F|nr:tol-pal system-associated acyl-CoA thioesterase [Paracoccus luteus]